MRILEFDQFEFPYASSEEHLRLFVEHRERVREPVEFLQRCLSEGERSQLMDGQAPVAYEECSWRGAVRDLLSHFTPELAAELAGS